MRDSQRGVSLGVNLIMKFIMLIIVLFFLDGCVDVIDKKITNQDNDVSYFCNKQYIANLSIKNEQLIPNYFKENIEFSCDKPNKILYIKADNKEFKIILEKIKNKDFMLIKVKNKDSTEYSSDYILLTYKILYEGLYTSIMNIKYELDSNLYNGIISYQPTKYAYKLTGSKKELQNFIIHNYDELFYRNPNIFLSKKGSNCFTYDKESKDCKKLKNTINNIFLNSKNTPMNSIAMKNKDAKEINLFSLEQSDNESKK